MSRLFALLVGIDAYPPPVPRLGGCANDVRAAGELLRGRVPEDLLDLRELSDGAATRAAVVAGIRGHLGRAGPDDVALLYYSGHGSQAAAPPEAWPQEPDLLLETLVLADSRLPGGWDLADKELGALLGEVAARGPHVITVLDCCHSGGGTRTADGVLRLRLAPPDPRPRPLEAFLPEALGSAVATRSVGTPATASRVLLAACRSSETAKEVSDQGAGRGALSAALEAALRAGGMPTYRQLHRQVTAAVLGRVPDQHPQLESVDPGDLDRAFLGGAVPAGPRRLVLSHHPDGWSVDAGAVHGIPEAAGADATTLAVRPLAGDGAPLTTATVTRVLPDRSLVTPARPLDPARAYSAEVAAIPVPPLKVALPDGADLTPDPALVAVVADPAEADVVVRVEAGGAVLTRPGHPRRGPVLAGEAWEARAAAALEHIARWQRLARLRNPVSRLPADAVAVDVVVPAHAGRAPAGTSPGGAPAGGGPPTEVELAYAAGAPPSFTVVLRNTTATPLWCALVDLTESWGIFTDAFPAGCVALGPGEQVEVALVGQVPDALWAAGVRSVSDHLKVITSTVEFDPRSMQQEELDAEGRPLGGPGPAVRGEIVPRSTLERLLAHVATRRLGPAPALEPVADWCTDDVFVRTTR